MNVLAGRTGKYTLGKEIGSGGNGVVFCAEGPAGTVAVKQLSKRDNLPRDSRARFGNEVRALEALSGIRGVLPILDSDPSTPPEWFAMPLAVEMRVQLGNNDSLQATCMALAGIAETLAKLHERGYSHRDLKPANLFWWDGYWCIGDFGLVYIPDATRMTNNKKQLGSAHYIAPEMLSNPGGADGKAADIYSLGKTIWVLATGQQVPFPGPHDAAHRASSIGSFHGSPRTYLLDELLCKMTLLEPQKRPSASEVHRELAALGSDWSPSAANDQAGILRELRAVLVPHVSREDAKRSSLEKARGTMRPLKEVVLRLAKLMENETGLPYAPTSGLRYWKYHQGINDPDAVHSEGDGATFLVYSGSSTYRLVMASSWHLLSDDTIQVGCGLIIDEVLDNNGGVIMTDPVGWSAEVRVASALPSGAQSVEQIGAELQISFPAVIGRFRDLIAGKS